MTAMKLPDYSSGCLSDAKEQMRPVMTTDDNPGNDESWVSGIMLGPALFYFSVVDTREPTRLLTKSSIDC